MSTPADDIVSNDGSWGDVYDDTKPAMVAGPLEHTGEQSSDDVTMRDGPAEQQSRGGAAAVEEAETKTNEQDVKQAVHPYKTDDEEMPMDLDSGSASETKYLPVKQLSAMRMETSTNPPANITIKQQNLNETAVTPAQPSASDPQMNNIPNELKGDEVESDSDALDTSSSDDSSSDSDDSDDSDTPFISKEEAQAMLEKYDNEESEDKDLDSSRYHRTTGEEPMCAPDIGDVVIGPYTQLLPLGHVIQRVGSTIVVRALAPIDQPMNYRAPGSRTELTIMVEHLRVLERGSVVCNTDSELLGGIADTIGQVQDPLYTIMFPELTDELVQKLKIDTGALIMYSPEHAIYALTTELKKAKYTDASDVHDNEDMDVEFSDDETETAYKRDYNAARKELSAQQKAAGKGRGHDEQQNLLPTRADWLKKREAKQLARQHLNDQISQARRTFTTNIKLGMPADQAQQEFIATERRLRDMPEPMEASPVSSHSGSNPNPKFVYINPDAIDNKPSDKSMLNYDDDSAGEASPGRIKNPIKRPQLLYPETTPQSSEDGYNILQRPALYGTSKFNAGMPPEHSMALDQQRARINGESGRGRGRGRCRGNQRGRGNRGGFNDRRQQREASYAPPGTQNNQRGGQEDPFHTAQSAQQPQGPAPTFSQAGPQSNAMPSQPYAFAPFPAGFPPGFAPGFAPPQQSGWPPFAPNATAAAPYASYQQQAAQQQMYSGQQYQQGYAAYGAQYQLPPQNAQPYPPAPQYYFGGQQQGDQNQQSNQ